jgi:hypothetical protein
MALFNYNNLLRDLKKWAEMKREAGKWWLPVLRQATPVDQFPPASQSFESPDIQSGSKDTLRYIVEFDKPTPSLPLTSKVEKSETVTIEREKEKGEVKRLVEKELGKHMTVTEHKEFRDQFEKVPDKIHFLQKVKIIENVKKKDSLMSKINDLNGQIPTSDTKERIGFIREKEELLKSIENINKQNEIFHNIQKNFHKVEKRSIEEKAASVESPHNPVYLTVHPNKTVIAPKIFNKEGIDRMLITVKTFNAPLSAVSRINNGVAVINTLKSNADLERVDKKLQEDLVMLQYCQEECLKLGIKFTLPIDKASGKEMDLTQVRQLYENSIKVKGLQLSSEASARTMSSEPGEKPGQSMLTQQNTAQTQSATLSQRTPNPTKPKVETGQEQPIEPPEKRKPPTKPL